MTSYGGFPNIKVKDLLKIGHRKVKSDGSNEFLELNLVRIEVLQ